MSNPGFVGGRSSNADDAEPGLSWFCLRSHPKHEHIAAGHLRQMEDVQVYNPRIRFSRSTRQGPVWVTEALFPNYLFARFDWRTSLQRVHYAPGVSCVVHFGTRWPCVPDQVITDLQTSLGCEDVHVIPRDLQPGDAVHISGGAFHGLNAVITKVMPGRERVMVLMEFLGRQSTVEVGVTSVIKEDSRR